MGSSERPSDAVANPGAMCGGGSVKEWPTATISEDLGHEQGYHDTCPRRFALAIQGVGEISL